MITVCDASIDPLKQPSSPKGNDGRTPRAGATRQENSDIKQDIRGPTEAARAAALRAPARVKRATGGHAEVVRALENRHRWLLFAQHCYTCTLREEECELGKLCTYGKKTLRHVAQCKKDDCSYPRCALLKPLLQHSRRCQSPTCAICVPVWNYIQKDMQQQQQPSAQQQQAQQHPQPPQSRTGQQSQPKAQPQPGQQINVAGGRAGEDSVGPSGSAQSTLAKHGASGAGPASGSGPGSAASSRTDLAAAAGLNGAGNGGSDSNGSRPKAADGPGGPGLGPAGPSGATAAALPHAVHAPQHPAATAAGAGAGASAPSGGGGAHRIHGLTAGGAAAAPYALPPYPGGGQAAVLSNPALDAADRPKVVVTTGAGSQALYKSTSATLPSQPQSQPPMSIPIPITATRAGGLQVPTGPAGHSPPLVHSYPPSGPLGAYFPQLVHHHAQLAQQQQHAAAGSSGAPSGVALATHWLPLQGLTAPPGAAGTSGGNGGVALGVSGGPQAGGGPSGTVPVPGGAMWNGAAQLRTGGPVALIGIPPTGADGLRPGGASGHPGSVQVIERYGPAYAVPAVGGAGGGNGVAAQAAYAMGPAAGPLLVWPAGHQPHPAAHVGPSSAAPGLTSPPGGHLSVHVAQPYAVAASGGARADGSAAGASHPAGAPSASAPAASASGHVMSAQAQALPPHALLGPPLFGQQALGHPSAGSAGGGGAPAGSVPAELATGAALWSYVLR